MCAYVSIAMAVESVQILPALGRCTETLMVSIPSANYGAGETLSSPVPSDAQHFSNRGRYVGETVARPQVDTPMNLRACNQDGHPFARVVSAWRRRVVTVVGGQDEYISVAQSLLDLGQA